MLTSVIAVTDSLKPILTAKMFGMHVRPRLVRMQNRELTFRVIAYNMHRPSVFMIWFLHSPPMINLSSDWCTLAG